ncbi:hypothetical protein K9O19_004394, partial [Salmonella enterica subsp. enterica serovar London]|nr:hypothetical protein [Salmonella enterica subsp. enterica serovar London]
MTSIISVGESKSFYPSLKSESVTLLDSYKVNIFKDAYGDSACIIRIIEIFMLNKLRHKGEKLRSLTGLTIPDTEAVADEINLLMSRFEKMCHREEEELSFRQREVSAAEYTLKNAGGNVNSRTIAEVKNNNTLKVERTACEQRYRSAILRQKEQQTRVGIFRGFGGMLVDEAEYIGKDINRRLLNSFTKPLSSPIEFIDIIYDAVLIRDIRFIIDALLTLESAVSHIIECCTIPTDRYVVERGGLNRALAYREYYRAENSILRTVISDHEYAEHAVRFNQITDYKNKLF